MVSESDEEEMVRERENDEAEMVRDMESDSVEMARGRESDDVKMTRGTKRDDEEMARGRESSDTEMDRERESDKAERKRECMEDLEGVLVIRDERNDIEIVDPIIETENLSLEAGYETEYEYEENQKSGKRKKMDEDEDTLGRYEFEIEEAVAEFEDERPTERNEIPESSDDSSEDEMDVRERKMKNRSEDKLALGSTYYTVYEFKELVLEYALNKRRNIKQDRWDKTKVSFVCGIGGKCKWRLYCSYDKDMQKWVLKTKYKYHSCTPDGKCKLLKSPVIARLFLDKLRQNADLMPEEIQQIIKEKWKIVSTRNQCQRGRLLALKWLQKEYDDQFAHLRGYAQEILETNKGSSSIVDTYKNVEGKDVFNRFF